MAERRTSHWRWARWIKALPIVTAALAGSTALAETRLALLIGNQDYPTEVGELSRTHQDVRVLAAALEGVGFDVAPLYDADEHEMEDALDDFEQSINDAAEADENVIAFFYFSGHGASTIDDGEHRNFLIPAKARVRNASQLIRRGMRLDRIIRGLGATRARTVFVVSDACRNTLAPGFGKGEKGFAPLVSRPGMFIASSTYPGETAPDDGAFADALAQRIRAPGQHAERAFLLAFRDVAEIRAGYRLPTMSPALLEDFCFNGCPDAFDGPGVAVVPQACTDETARQLWNDLRESEAIEDLEGFASLCHGAPQAMLASNRAGRLRAQRAAVSDEATQPGGGAADGWSPGEAEHKVAQRALRRLRLYDGQIDGVWGGDSQDALRRFQHDLGFSPADGALTRASLQALMTAEPAPAASAAGAAHAMDFGVFRDCPACPQMVALPAGSFAMGSPEQETFREYNEGPVRTVSVGRFAIGQTEVTFAHWDACLADGGCGGYRPDDRGWGRGDRPVVLVSWHDAQAFVAWLNSKVGGAPYRLPSEAEWEYAARAGRSSGAFWTGGRIGPSQANFDATHSYDGSRTGDFRRRTLAARSLPANPWGLYEILGNAREWVIDCWHRRYDGAPTGSSPWLAEDGGDCDRATPKGGGWLDHPRSLRIANRYGAARAQRSQVIGFRVAREFQP